MIVLCFLSYQQSPLTHCRISLFTVSRSEIKKNIKTVGRLPDALPVLDEIPNDLILLILLSSGQSQDDFSRILLKIPNSMTFQMKNKKWT